MRHYPGQGFNGGHLLLGFLGFIGTLVLLGLITLFVLYLVKRSKGKTGAPLGAGHPHSFRQPMPPAVQILDERLARGEIEVEDYMTRKAALLGGAGPVPNEWQPQPPQQPPAPPVPPEEPKHDPEG